MKPAKRKNTNWKQSLATLFLLAGTITLTACGGGGGGGGSSSSAPSTVSTPAPAPASTPSADQDPQGIIEEPGPSVGNEFARVITPAIKATKLSHSELWGG
jgi:ABC-type glycerol-3-phosphate transport system substrate-binding protein